MARGDELLSGQTAGATKRGDELLLGDSPDEGPNLLRKAADFIMPIERVEEFQAETDLSQDPRQRRLQILANIAGQEAEVAQLNQSSANLLQRFTGGVAGTLAGLLVPGASRAKEGLTRSGLMGLAAQRVALGAAGGGVSAGIEAGVGGQEILPAVGRGALAGGVLGPVAGALIDIPAMRAAAKTPVARQAVDQISERQTVGLSSGSPKPMSGARLIDLEDATQATQAVGRARLQDLESYQDRFASAPHPPIEPHPIGSAPSRGLDIEPQAPAWRAGPLPGERVVDLPEATSPRQPRVAGLEVRPAPAQTLAGRVLPESVGGTGRDIDITRAPGFESGGLPGAEPIPRVPTAEEQLDFFAPRQTTFLGPPAGKPPKQPIGPRMALGKVKAGPVRGLETTPTFRPTPEPKTKTPGSTKTPKPPEPTTPPEKTGPLEIERFPTFRLSERSGAAGNLTGSARAAMEADPDMIAMGRGLWAEIGKHPTLEDRGKRLAFASSALGREVDSFNKLTNTERRGLMLQLKRLRKTAESTPEGVAMTRADDLASQSFSIPGPQSERFAGLREVYHRALTSVGSRLKQFGASGGEIAERMDRASMIADRRIANDLLDTERALKGLNFSQRLAVTEAMRGAPTTNPAVRSAAAELTRILSQYADEAERAALPVLNPATGKTTPFQRMANYFPEIHTDQSIAKYAKPHEIATARAQLRHLPRKYRGGGIQFARVADIPGWERDPLVALPMYFRRSAKRLAVAREFGARDQEALGLIQEVGQSHGSDAANRARALYTAFADPGQREMAGLLQPIRDAAAVGLLTTTAVIQPSQLANTIAREGFFNTVRALRQIITKPAAREWAERTGATVSSLMNDISPDGKSIADTWSKIIGLKASDRAVRLTNAIAGKLRAEQVAKALREGRITPAVIRDAGRLGIPSNGIIDDEILSLAGQRAANESQFASRMQDLPEWRENEIGRTLYFLKSFTLQQGRFIKELVKDAKQGHWSPLLKFAGATAVIGQPIGELVRAMRGDEASDDPKWRALENLAYVASLGTFQDAVRAASRGRDGLLQFAAGPLPTEASRLGSELYQTAQGEPEALEEHLLQRTVQRVPFIGRQLADQLYQ